MKKPIAMLAVVMALVLVVALPLSVQAEIGKSGTIIINLTYEQMKHIILETAGLDVEIVVTEGPPYAELDATVFGIDSADVGYGVEVVKAELKEGENEQDVVALKAFHNGSDVGMNSVKLTLFVPSTGIGILELAMTGSTLSYENIPVVEMDGIVNGGKIALKTDVVQAITLAGNDTELNMEGEFHALNLVLVQGSAKVTSTVVPAVVLIDTTGADVNLKVPDTAEGFVMNYAIRDGKLDTNFASDYNEAEGTITYGAGEAKFDITGTGANVKVDN